MSDENNQPLLVEYRLIDVTPATHDRLVEAAKQRGITVEELVELALAHVGVN